MIPLDFWHTTVGPEFFGAVLFLSAISRMLLDLSPFVGCVYRQMPVY